MKIFKRVYYPVMAALLVLMLVLGIVDARTGGMGGKLTSEQVDGAYTYATEIAEHGTHNSYASGTQTNVQNYILSKLTDPSVGAERRYKDVNVTEDEDGNVTVDYFSNSDGIRPSVLVQESAVRQEAQVNGETQIAVRTVENIILAIPGTEPTADAILLHARYDSSANGGASDATAVGALLENAVEAVKAYNSGTQYTNTIIFLFGDAGQEGDLGAAAFIHQFVGFDNVVSKIRAVADFSVGGTGGTLMMYGDTSGNLNLVGKYSRFNGDTLASSALSTLLKKSDYSGSGVFGDYNTLSFTNRGGFNDYATARDTSVNKTLVKQQANAMNKFLTCYADASLADIDSESSAVYFSYLDVMTVYYPVAVAFVIAGIIIGLVIAIVILNIKNKTFSWGKTLAGAAVQLVTVLASSLLLLALYYLFALLLSGFGVVPFQGISSIRYAGTGLLISAILMAVTVAIFLYILLKRTFAVKATDVVRGNTLLFALVAVILSFAVPALSYPFTCVAIFSLLAMLMTVIFKKKFKQKYSMDIERLFLYVWAIVFSLPLLLPLIYASQTLFLAVTLVLVLALVIGLAGFVAPYADYLKPAIDKVFHKLPERSVRYERTETVKVEDKAKKGKFHEETRTKIVVEKEPWVYRNRIGLSFVAVVSAVMIVLFCAFGSHFSSSAMATPSYNNAVYDDALLLVYEQNGDSAATATVEVRDLIAYDYIRYAVNDMTWNGDKKAYTKEYTGSVNDIITEPSDFTKSGDVVTFNVYDAQHSQVTLKLTNAKSISKIAFNVGDAKLETEEYTFYNQDEITFILPYGYGEDNNSFTMTVDGSCDIAFEQHIYNDSLLTIHKDNDWDKLYGYYLSNKDVGPALKSGIVIKITKSV